ncbi:MAG TPA: hypothetical protein DHS57_04605 [Erysipelotrichaceae bacterium]|nr:hypothetical protein [Erysipelotrichaceae bacterium]
MKKILSILFVFILLIGCSSNNVIEDTAIEDDFEKTMQELQKEILEEYEKENSLDDSEMVTIDQLPYEIVHMDDKLDSSGAAYVHYVFHNNSKFPILRFELSGVLKDTNEKTYYVHYLTVMPNETSTQFDSFAPTSLNVDDIEIKSILYYYLDSNDRKIEVEYNVLKDEYETFIRPLSEFVEDLDVKYDQLPFEFKGIDTKADNNGVAFAYFSFTNNSNYVIKYFSIDGIRMDSNNHSHFTCRDSVQPGETSPIFKGVAPLTFNMDDIKLIQIEYEYINENEKTVKVSYDLQLDKYTYARESILN